MADVALHTDKEKISQCLGKQPLFRFRARPLRTACSRSSRMLFHCVPRRPELSNGTRSYSLYLDSYCSAGVLANGISNRNRALMENADFSFADR